MGDSAPCTDQHHHHDLGSASSMSAMMNHGMAMTFSHSTGPLAVLFPFIVAGPSLFSYLAHCALVVLVGVLRQFLYKMSDDRALSMDARSAVYFAQATLAYLLMLVSMTYNYGLFFAVILGLTLGHRRYLMPMEIDKGECCS